MKMKAREWEVERELERMWKEQTYRPRKKKKRGQNDDGKYEISHMNFDGVC